MFKKIILAAALVVSAAFAQSSVNVGGRAAVDYGSAWGDKSDAEWGAGFNAGINLKVGINDMLSFVPGLEIDLRRITSEDTYRGETLEETLSMWYLDIPLALRINANPQFFIDAGLYLGVMLSAEDTREAMGQSASMDVGDSMESIDIGILAGVGFNVMPNLDVNFRLALGLTEMVKEAKGSKNMRLQLGGTYWFM